MESHLHTLHLVKCNNEHKIIKSRLKAICRALYNSRLELERKQVCVDKFSLLLKVHSGVNAHSAGSSLGGESVFCVSGFAALCLLSVRGVIPRLFMVAGVPGD